MISEGRDANAGVFLLSGDTTPMDRQAALALWTSPAAVPPPTGGIVIETCARFGCTAAPGTTDDARLRHLNVALPPEYAARLFDAQQAVATERQLRGIAADGLAARQGLEPEPGRGTSSKRRAEREET